MELKTPSGRAIDAAAIDHILWGRMATDILGTLVQLKTGDEVFLLNSDEEVVQAMSKDVGKPAASSPQNLVIHAKIIWRQNRTEVIYTNRRVNRRGPQRAPRSLSEKA